MKLQESVCGTFPKVKVHYLPMLCHHCDNPACMDACRHDAIFKRDDGLVIIDPDNCELKAECKDCIAACLYDAIYYNDELNLSQKCTGCAHLLDSGHTLPRCVEVCPTDAMCFGEVEDLEDHIAAAVRLRPESVCDPNVYYLNIPGKFGTGTVFDPVEREVIIGASCLLTSGGNIVETFTDAYGDFWFKDLKVGTCSVTIEAQGFQARYFPDLDTEKGY